MDRKDVPQAQSLDRVRDVVQAVQDGATEPVAIQHLVGSSPRQIEYNLQAARILGLLSNEEEKRWTVAASGRRLLATAPLSDAEKMVFRQVIRDSALIKEFAPVLLDEREATLATMTFEISKASGLGLETARRRAQTLLAWRERVLPPPEAGFFDLGAPASSGDEPGSSRPRDGVRSSTTRTR